MKEAWQQTRKTLHRWVHITMMGYGLVQLLSRSNSQVVNTLCRHSPWRKKSKTAGQIRKGLVAILRHGAVSSSGTQNAINSYRQIGLKMEILSMNVLNQHNTRKKYRTINRTKLKIISMGGQVRSKL